MFSDGEFVIYSKLTTGSENSEIVAGVAVVRGDDLMDQSFEGVWKR